MTNTSSPAPSPQKVTSSDLTIRRMRDADIEDVMAIESVSFGVYHWSASSFQNELKNQLARYYVLVHKKRNQVIGYCGYWIVMDEAHITTIAVSPEFRGNALGELLLVRMLDRMGSQSVKWVTLEVRVSNFAAQQLYYKYNYQTQGIRPHYYQDTREDAIIMTAGSIQDKAFRDIFRENAAKLMDRLGGEFPEGMRTS